jgi:hypothetical protein
MTLAHILELTDRVQAAIDAGEWLAAQDVEVERRAAIEQLVAEQGAGVDVKDALAQLQTRNQRMIGEVHHHRRRVLRDASMVKTGQSAASAYGDSLPTAAGSR